MVKTLPTSLKVLKIVFFGSDSIGKTCLIERFVDGEFPKNTLPTIGPDFKMKKVIIDDLELKLHLFDTAGQERYKTITETYYEGADGVVIMFDLTDQSSFDEAKVWLEYMKNHNDQKACKMVLGNKCDLREKRIIDKQAITELAKKAKAPYFEVSAKTGENMEVALLHLARVLKRALIPSKIVVAGTGAIGKTCLIHTLVDGEFPLQTLPTIGLNFRDKMVMIENSKLKFQFCDTPGHSKYHDITKSSFHSACGVLIVFDLTDQNSFDEVIPWIEHLKKNNDKKICKMILGNKCDLEEKRVVDKQTIRDLVKEVRVPYFEVSAKTGENVGDALLNFARDIKRTFIDDDKLLETRNDENDNENNDTKLELANLNGAGVSECNLY